MRLSLLVASLVLSAPLHAQRRAADAPPPEIVASGIGRVTVMPDRATIDVMVETREATAVAAGRENARKQGAVIDTLRRIGFGPDVVTTSRYAVNTDMRYGGERGQQVVGYVARNAVRVEVRDLGRLPDIIDAVLAAGANNIGGIDYKSSRQRELEMQALDSAVANARARAEVLARAAQGRLGMLLDLTTEINESRVAGGQTYARALAEVTTITPGQLTISAAVLGRWRFEQRAP